MSVLEGRPRIFRIGDTYILIVGLRGKAEVKLAGNSALIPSSSFYSLRHLVMAAIRAIRSFRAGKNISENFAYELGICLLGIREVSKVKEILLSQATEEYAFTSYCSSMEDCLRPLMSTLMLGFSLSDVRPSYSLEELASCTGNVECLALERGITVELER